MHSKTVFIISQHLNHSTGINFQSIELLNYLRKKNYNVVYCSIWNQTLHTNIYDFPVYNLNNIKEAYDLFVKYQPEFVITFHDIWKLDFIFELKKILPFKLITYLMFESREKLELTFYNHNGEIIDLYKQYFHLIDKIVFSSVSSLLALKDYNIKSYHIIHPFIKKDLEYNEKYKQNFIKNFVPNYDPNFIYFGLVSRNFERKNIPFYFIYLNKLKKENINNIKFIMISNKRTPYGQDLNFLAKNNNMENDFILIDNNGFLNEEHLNGFYSTIDTYLTFSFGEGFCYPLFESILCGANALCAPVGGISTYIPLQHNFDNIFSAKYFNNYYPQGINQRWHNVNMKELISLTIELNNNNKLKRNFKSLTPFTIKESYLEHKYNPYDKWSHLLNVLDNTSKVIKIGKS